MISRLKGKFVYLSLESFDESTAEGRTKERYRLSALAALSGLVSNILTMATMVITVPLTLGYLGEERFGVWMTIGSVATLLSFLDLGIGNGLVNRVAKARVDADPNYLSYVISHGLIVLTLVGVLIGSILVCLLQFFSVESLIKVSNQSVAAEVKDSILVFCVIFAVSIPLGGVQKVFQGQQRTWIATAVKGMGALLSLLLVYFLAAQKVGVPALLFATYGIQTLIMCVLLYLLYKDKKLCVPRFVFSGFISESKTLLSVGGLFLVLQIGYLVGWSSDSLIVSSVVGADGVTKLALLQRLFQFVYLPLTLINAPLWSAYADAHANGDNDFVRSTLLGAIKRTSLLALIGCLGIVSFSSYIFQIWLNAKVSVSLDFVIIYAIWIFVQCVFMPVTMFLNGLGIVKIQMYVVVLFCIVCLPMKIYFAHLFGAVGVIQAAVLSYVMVAVIPYAWLFFRGGLRSYVVCERKFVA